MAKSGQICGRGWHTPAALHWPTGLAQYWLAAQLAFVEQARGPRTAPWLRDGAASQPASTPVTARAPCPSWPRKLRRDSLTRQALFSANRVTLSNMSNLLQAENI